MTCKANQWAGFYILGISVMKELIAKSIKIIIDLLGYNSY